MIGLIVLGLAFLFFIVVAFFAAKTWHVGHVVAMAFLFLFTLLTLFMTATLMRTNKQFHPKYSAAVENLERKQAENERLVTGSGSDALAMGTISGEQVLAKRDRQSRGRVWRNAVPVQVGNEQRPFVIRMNAWNNDGCLRVGKEEDELSEEELEPIAEEEEAADEGGEEGEAEAADEGPETTHGIQKGQYVYAFKEMPIIRLSDAQKKIYFGSLSEEGDELFPNKDKSGLCRVPVAYLGKFQVIDSQADVVAVKLEGIPDAGQAAHLQQRPGPQLRWVLYEQLPVDFTGLFEGKEKQQIAELLPLRSPPNQWSLQTAGVSISRPDYDRMINEYYQDGRDFKGRADDFRVRVLVEFTTTHERVVDLQVGTDAEGNPRPLPAADAPFNSEGLAQIPGLLQGGEGKTVFEEGETAYFDGATAQALIRAGKAREVADSRKYVRPLRSFEFGMDDFQKRFDEVAVQVKSVDSRVKALEASLERLQSQIDKHQEELNLLQSDKEGFDSEMKSLGNFRKELQERRAILEGEVNALSGGYAT